MKDLTEEIIYISRNLREQSLNNEREDFSPNELPRKPDIYYEYGPCGSYPIIAFRTTPCKMHMAGYCTPCGYSRRSFLKEWDSSDYNISLMSQLNWILMNFDKICIERQTGQLKGYKLRKAPDRPWYMLQLSGVSSFFSDEEIPTKLRREILERLICFQDEKGINLHVMLECRPEHIVLINNSGELEKLAPIFEALNVVVNIGLEYYDDWLRNTLYAKNLNLQVFEEAVKISKLWKLDPGVFIFAGGFILTVNEILNETLRSLRYLENLGVFANIMIPNVQDYTIPALLWKLGLYELPEPFFLLDIIDLALSFHPKRVHPVTPFNWFIGGLTADPAPLATLLDNPRCKTPNSTISEIYSIFLELVKTQNSLKFLRLAELLRKKPEYQAYKAQLERRDARPRSERLRTLLRVAKSCLSRYSAHARDECWGIR